MEAYAHYIYYEENFMILPLLWTTCCSREKFLPWLALQSVRSLNIALDPLFILSDMGMVVLSYLDDRLSVSYPYDVQSL